MAQYTQGLYQSIIKSRVFQFLSHRLDTRLVPDPERSYYTHGPQLSEQKRVMAGGDERGQLKLKEEAWTMLKLLHSV